MPTECAGQQCTWIKSKVHLVAAARADFEIFSPNFIAGHLWVERLWQRWRWKQRVTASRTISRLLSPCLSVAGDGRRTHSAAAANANTECAVPWQSAAPSLHLFFIHFARVHTCLCLARHGQMCLRQKQTPVLSANYHSAADGYDTALMELRQNLLTLQLTNLTWQILVTKITKKNWFSVLPTTRGAVEWLIWWRNNCGSGSFRIVRTSKGSEWLPDWKLLLHCDRIFTLRHFWPSSRKMSCSQTWNFVCQKWKTHKNLSFCSFFLFFFLKFVHWNNISKKGGKVEQCSGDDRWHYLTE